MPLFESICGKCGEMREYYVPHWYSPDPECCGEQTKRLVSEFGVVFTGVLSASKYNDPKLERAHQGPHWGWRRRSSKSGKPEPVYIETFEDQKKFCKEEGLVNPKDIGNIEATSDGKFNSSTGRGTRGQWV